MWVYLGIFLCVRPPFYGCRMPFLLLANLSLSVFPWRSGLQSMRSQRVLQSCLKRLRTHTCLLLFFILPASSCFLSLFVDGCKGPMLILSWYPLVHILSCFHKAPLSFLSLSVVPPIPIYSDTCHALFTQLNLLRLFVTLGTIIGTSKIWSMENVRARHWLWYNFFRMSSSNCSYDRWSQGISKLR